MSTSRKNEVLSLVLLVGAILFMGLAAGKMVGYALAARTEIGFSGEETKLYSKKGEVFKEVQKQNQEVAGGLKQRNLFYAPPKPPSAPSSCQAIFGDEAYIEGKWAGVGATLKGGAKLIAIEATYVVIEHEGQEKKLAPIAAAGANDGASVSSGSPSRVSESQTGRSRGDMPAEIRSGLQRRGRRGFGGRDSMSSEERR